MLGISTYAYLWRTKPEAPHPMTLADILRDAHRLGLGLVQICDSEELDRADAAALRDLRALADELGLELEVGTRGVGADHLRRYLGLAGALRAAGIRSMFATREHRPTVSEARASLRAVAPELEAAGVWLALETYEQLPTRDLVELVEAVGSPRVGVCLDPGNCLAALERPDEVIGLAAPHTLNVHLKDVGYAHSDDQIGFRLAGRPMGEGLLPLDDLLAAVGEGPNRIIEHWIPWQGDWTTQVRVEDQWIAREVAYLREVASR